MVELIVNGKKHLLLDKQDKCPICDTPRNKMYFTWRLFHGEADSSCCGAIYQIKDYGIQNPTDEETKLLEMLSVRGDFIEFKIKLDWIEPFRRALKETGKRKITDEGVVEVATRLFESKE